MKIKLSVFTKNGHGNPVWKNRDSSQESDSAEGSFPLDARIFFASVSLGAGIA
jgi:hypothetical protein